jgi:hypothetical protein
VAVDEGIVVSAQQGTLERAVVRAAGERLRGRVTDQGTTCRAAERAGAALPGASLWAMWGRRALEPATHAWEFG